MNDLGIFFLNQICTVHTFFWEKGTYEILYYFFLNPPSYVFIDGGQYWLAWIRLLFRKRWKFWDSKIKGGYFCISCDSALNKCWQCSLIYCLHFWNAFFFRCYFISFVWNMGIFLSLHLFVVLRTDKKLLEMSSERNCFSLHLPLALLYRKKWRWRNKNWKTGHFCHD